MLTKAFSTSLAQRIKLTDLSIRYFKLGKWLFQVLKNANVFVNSNISHILGVSLSIDIIARFVSFSSVIVDLWNVLTSLNLLKLRSVVLLIAVIGKLSLEWCQAPFLWASAVIFPGGNVDILLILFRLLTMQCKRTFTKRFTLSSQKEIVPFYSNSNKNFASLAAIARYIAISHKRDYLQILSRVLFYKEANCHGL